MRAASAGDRAGLPSISHFLLVRIVGICVLSFALLGGAAYTLIVRPAQDEMSRVAMDLTADRLEEEFDATATDATRLLSALRDWAQLGTTNLNEPADLVRIAISHLLNRPYLLNVLFARADGIALIVGRNGPGFLVRMIDNREGPGPQRWLHYDVGGRLLGEESVARDYDPRTRSWFKGAMRTEFGGHYWTDPYLFFETRDPGLTISTALEPAPGEDPLVIGLDLTVRGISALTMQYRLGQSGGMALLTADGRVLGLPYGADRRRNEGASDGLLRLPAELGLTAVARGWDMWLAQGRQPVAGMFDVEGEPWIGRFRQLRLDNLSLIIAAVAPRKDFTFAGTRDAAMLASLVAGIVVLAWFLSRQIARRFQRVMQALAAESARIGALELDRPVQVPSRLREITALVEAQERMRLMLRAATSELEQTVATRTRELADREALLRMILDTVPIGLSMVREGSQPVMLMANAAGARMFGYEPDELVGHPVIDMWARPQDRDDYIARLRQDGAVGGFEARMRRRDGSEFWVSFTTAVARHLGETIDLAAYEDVTARREAEDQVRRYGALIRRITDTAPAALFEAHVAPAVAGGSAAVSFNFLSRSVEPILGVSAEDILRDPARRFIHVDADDRAHLLAVADRLADATLASQDEFRVTLGGEERWVLTQRQALRRNPDGSGSFVGFYVDITERKRNEQTLKLEKQRTEDALRQLREAQAQLVQAEKMTALAGLVAGVAHEINTPVGIAFTAASTLADEATALRALTDAGTAKRSDVMRFLALAEETATLMETHCRNAADLIQSFKKVAVDQSSDDRRQFELKPYLEETVLSLRPQYRKAGHRVVVECPDDIALDSHPGAISQIVTNLIMNSTIHAFAEGVAGNLRLTARRMEGGRIQLCYQDDGRGIPPEHRARIFEPFFTTRRGQGGSGLGLHILHNLVAAKLGGQVRYEDTAGGGATFVMEFPAIAKA